MLISSACGGGCPPCSTGCIPCSTGDFLITLEPVGSGWVMLVADDDMIGADWIGCSGGNATFWSNVAAFISSGTVGAPDGYTSNYRPGDTAVTGMEPTVGVASALNLVGLSAAWCGWYQGFIANAAYAWLPVTNAELQSWVEGGGLLIVVSETAEDITGNGEVSAFNVAANTLLGNIGACSRFIDANYDVRCAVPETNPSSSLIDGTYGTANPDIRYLKAGACCPGSNGTWVARVGTAPLTCTEINDGPYGILIADGSLASQTFHMCLAFDETGQGNSWYGQTTNALALACGNKVLGIRIYCDISVPKWKADIINVTDGTTETYDLGETSTNPLNATLSETLANFCGSDALVVDIDACTDPPFADCCPGDEAALCCLEDNATISAQGAVVETFPGSGDCVDCSTSLGQWGWNYGNPPTSTGNLWASARYFWHGPLGVDDLFSSYAGYEGILSCTGSGWEAIAVNSSGDPSGNGTLETGFTFCTTPSGTIAWDLLTDGCCAGGAGTFKTVLS